MRGETEGHGREPVRMPEIEVETRRRFEELALPHLKSLYRFASRLTGNRGTAEELVQETFLKALEAFPTLRDPARSKAWLFQILSRLAIDRHRREAQAVTVEVAEDLDHFSHAGCIHLDLCDPACQAAKLRGNEYQRHQRPFAFSPSLLPSGGCPGSGPCTFGAGCGPI